MNSTTAAVAAPLEPEVVEESAALRVELVVADPSRDDLVHDVVRDGTHGALLVTSRSTLSKARRRLRMARLLARARAMSRSIAALGDEAAVARKILATTRHASSIEATRRACYAGLSLWAVLGSNQ